MTPEFHVFLPQMRMTLEAIVERAQAAEAAGFVGMSGMDHLVPPLALDQPMYEAMSTNMWLAAHTTRLRLGSLVLCDAFRHPAMLAREAVAIDNASGGRFELGIGSGSVDDELDTFGIGPRSARERTRRMGETLEVLRALWSGESFSYAGEFFTFRDAQQLPTPLTRIPIVIGGAGPRTMDLVAAHADWWNCPIHRLDKLDEMRPRAGRARVSTQQMVTLVTDEADRDRVLQSAERRFGMMGKGRAAGGAAEVVDFYGALVERGVERFYVWFTDFAAPDTVAAFGGGVISQFG
ncbi:MAG TPA: LLM class flavin-dependent oxidoreductase [Acidimicrobiia bacterium]|nr:LLM class flavin-dependent oxidoreductase [Acidimicrobiia bacterium]